MSPSAGDSGLGGAVPAPLAHRKVLVAFSGLMLLSGDWTGGKDDREVEELMRRLARELVPEAPHSAS